MIGAIVLLVVAAGAALGAAIGLSGATLEGDSSALAHVSLGALGGKLVSATAATSAGDQIPLVVSGDKLTPKSKVAPGEQIIVSATVQRPSSLGWALGKTHDLSVTVTAPLATVANHWLTVKGGQMVTASFDQPVERATAHTANGATKQLAMEGPSKTVELGTRAEAGTVQLANAPRAWEKMGTPTTVSWFPASAHPVVVADPTAGSELAPSQSLRLTFSKTVKETLGGVRPTVSPAGSGHWTEPNSHTLLYKTTGGGFGLGTKVTVNLPKSVNTATASGVSSQTTDQLTWTVPPGSMDRLQQLLAEDGYLPLSFVEDVPVAHTRAAESAAAVNAPAGHFTWRYSNTPPELKALWDEGQPNTIIRGAVMMFQNEHGLAVDGAAGAEVWNALIADTVAGKKKTDGYSYVYVHRAVPQLLTLWHNGKVVLTSPGNTGIPAAPTELGSFPVFEHLPVTTMSGENPDGSKYNDPGIKWVSYFNGGDALHTFNRASFGTPQSLGCVELPEASAAKVYPYTPIGVLVTIEDHSPSKA